LFRQVGDTDSHCATRVDAFHPPDKYPCDSAYTFGRLLAILICGTAPGGFHIYISGSYKMRCRGQLSTTPLPFHDSDYTSDLRQLNLGCRHLLNLPLWSSPQTQPIPTPVATWAQEIARRRQPIRHPAGTSMGDLCRMEQTIQYAVGFPILYLVPINLHDLGSDIIHLNVAGTSIVVLSSLEAVRQLFERRSSLYSDR
jgi:hypothetical protein